MPSARLLISTANLERNYKLIQKYIGNKVIYPVVKANAYGIGIEFVLPILLKSGIKTICVAKAFEGQDIRKINSDLKILVFEPSILESDINIICKNNLIASVTSVKQCQMFLAKAKQLKIKIKISIMVETGFYRYGASLTEVDKIQNLVKNSQYIKIHSIYSHLACSDSLKDSCLVLSQIQILNTVAEKINAPMHIFSSSGIINYKKHIQKIVRAGAILYGAWPSSTLREKNKKLLDIKSVGTLQGMITEIKHIKTGSSVGYGHTWQAQNDCYIAVIAAGYAYGIPRDLSNKGYVLLNGKKLPIIGRVSMDSCTVLLGEDNSQQLIGQWVTFWGEDKTGKVIEPDEVAAAAGTCVHEILSAVPDRVQRVLV